MLGKASLGMPYLTFAQGIGDRVYAFHSHGPWYAINLSQDQLVSGSSLARPKVDLGYAINVFQRVHWHGQKWTSGMQSICLNGFWSSSVL